MKQCASGTGTDTASRAQQILAECYRRKYFFLMCLDHMFIMCLLIHYFLIHIYSTFYLPPLHRPISSSNTRLSKFWSSSDILFQCIPSGLQAGQAFSGKVVVFVDDDNKYRQTTAVQALGP